MNAAIPTADVTDGTTRTVHATTVALAGHAVMLVGAPGSGKSDLALRLLDRGWHLVSDDRTILSLAGDALHAAAPATIAGRMEVRGIGIVPVPHVGPVPVMLVCDLDLPVQRMPDPMPREIIGVALPCIALAALEPSAPLKVELALRRILA